MAAAADFEPGAILRDTAGEIRRVLGEDCGGLTIDEVVFGLFFTGVALSHGQGGICATPIKSIPEAVCCPSSIQAMPMPGKLRGRLAASFLDDPGPPNSLRRALFIAVLSALSLAAMTEAEAVDVARGMDGLDAARIADGDNVVLVGALGPMIKALKARGGPFHILEKDPATLRPDEMAFYAPADTAPEVVPKADVLVTTGTTLINDTLEGLLELVRPGAEVVVVGPTASLLPGAFFRRGVRVLGGVRVTESRRLLDMLAEGGSGYHFFGRAAERIVMTSG